MPDDEGLRERLADRIGELRNEPATESWTDEQIADALLPVVERYAARRTAEALAAIGRVRALLPRITELAEFEQEAERDATSILLVRDHLSRALAADGTQPRPSVDERLAELVNWSRREQSAEQRRRAEASVPRPAHRQDETETGR